MKRRDALRLIAGAAAQVFCARNVLATGETRRATAASDSETSKTRDLASPASSQAASKPAQPETSPSSRPASRPASERKDVILCFDCGTRDDRKYRESMDLAKEISRTTGEDARFTYYLTSAMLLQRGRGRSEVGWGGSAAEIEKRVALIQEVVDQGHELGCHTVRHPHGEKFTKEQWLEELREFAEHMARFKEKTGNPARARGFRAPFLEYNNALYAALSEMEYVYDVSQPAEGIRWKNGIAVIGMPMYEARGKRVIGMDYNLQAKSVTGDQFKEMLAGESRKKTIVISLHLEDYGCAGVRYFDVAKEFMLAGAREGRFRFVSMLEYAMGLKAKVSEI